MNTRIPSIAAALIATALTAASLQAAPNLVNKGRAGYQVKATPAKQQIVQTEQRDTQVRTVAIQVGQKETKTHTPRIAGRSGHRFHR